MRTNQVLAFVGCTLLGLLVFRTEQRIDRIEEKLDAIIQTADAIKYTKHELECLTKNIYYEAGVEDTAGKYAVAHVTLNRLKTGFWGKDICKVVYAKSQFSWTLKKKLPKPHPALWAESKEIAINALEGARVNSLHNSLFYHADYIKQPKWVDPVHYATKIGQHIFYNKAKNSWLTI